jgi:hypothetical protein
MEESQTDNEFAKVGFYDDDGDVETLWAIRVGENLYRLDNSPFFIYGVSWQDVVEAQPEEDGFLFFVRVVEKSGHCTLRVMFNDFSAEDAEAEPILADIKNLGCSYEGDVNVLVIDVPPEVNLETVTDYLINSELEWEYANPTYEELFPEG